MEVPERLKDMKIYNGQTLLGTYRQISSKDFKDNSKQLAIALGELTARYIGRGVAVYLSVNLALDCFNQPQLGPLSVVNCTALYFLYSDYLSDKIELIHEANKNDF